MSCDGLRSRIEVCDYIDGTSREVKKFVSLNYFNSDLNKILLAEILYHYYYTMSRAILYNVKNNNNFLYINLIYI